MLDANNISARSYASHITMRLSCLNYSNTFKTPHTLESGNVIRYSQQYFLPKIGRRIRIFSLSRKINILDKKECMAGSERCPISSWKNSHIHSANGWVKRSIAIFFFGVELWRVFTFKNVESMILQRETGHYLCTHYM